MSSAASSLMRSTGNLLVLAFSLLVMPHIIFLSTLEKARLMAIDHSKEQGIDVEFDLQIVFLLTPVQSFMD